MQKPGGKSIHQTVEVKVESSGINPTFDDDRIFLGFPDLNSLEISYNSVMMTPVLLHWQHALDILAHHVVALCP